ncbi:hypothetical protein GWI33_015706 [Rhynchophorus ferrugineus]|uniref:Uncharacterized protein n=1 Tax=Rhynchophorus ferrugineus TaxID=354439 RepID=A0A834I4V8_RHYFE|nr:hypothetical protein GWI33_015706 [Rhynchophorus ferrugineus]
MGVCRPMNNKEEKCDNVDPIIRVGTFDSAICSSANFKLSGLRISFAGEEPPGRSKKRFPVSSRESNKTKDWRARGPSGCARILFVRLFEIRHTAYPVATRKTKADCDRQADVTT